jgi:hypothetical protein
MRITIMHKEGFKVVDLNRRKAIHEKCLNCSAWVAKEVVGCTFSDCPLYPFRTGREKQNPKKRQSAVKNYCQFCQGGQTGEVTKCPSKTCPLFHFRGKGKDKANNTALNPENVHPEAIFRTEIRQDIAEAREVPL